MMICTRRSSALKHFVARALRNSEFFENISWIELELHLTRDIDERPEHRPLRVYHSDFFVVEAWLMDDDR